MIKVENSVISVSGKSHELINETCCLIEEIYAQLGAIDKSCFTEMLIGSMNTGLFGDMEEEDE